MQKASRKPNDCLVALASASEARVTCVDTQPRRLIQSVAGCGESPYIEILFLPRADRKINTIVFKVNENLGQKLMHSRGGGFPKDSFELWDAHWRVVDEPRYEGGRRLRGWL